MKPKMYLVAIVMLLLCGVIITGSDINDHVKADVGDINSPASSSYEIALPIIMNGYCSAPYTDDFSNPNSGWPIDVSGSSTYRYIDDEYNIFQAETDRWSAVTAGNVWENSERLQVEAHINNNKNGGYGIIYGLNDDWSDFYTFEIYPEYQVFAFFHFTSAAGWTLVHDQNDFSISKTGMNTLAIGGTPTNGMEFYVNNGAVYFDNNQKIGRVGFTGVSLTSNVDIRYDNYLFAGENCPVVAQANRRSAGIDSAAFMERPSIETFLSDN